MSKGVLEMPQSNNGGGNSDKTSALRFLKEGESIIVGVPSVKEFYLKQTVSVYDSVNNVPVILPTVVEEKNLYDAVVKELWNDYNEVKTDDVERKKVLNKINALKRQDTVFVGMKDINTGEDIILSMGINLQEGRQNKAGNNFYQGITKLEKQLAKFPLEITKGAKGAWTIIPYMDELTEEQQANFDSVAEISDEVYESVFFRSDEEKQASDIRKFGEKYGFDVTRVGISAAVEPSTEVGEEDMPF